MTGIKSKIFTTAIMLLMAASVCAFDVPLVGAERNAFFYSFKKPGSGNGYMVLQIEDKETGQRLDALEVKRMPNFGLSGDWYACWTGWVGEGKFSLRIRRAGYQDCLIDSVRVARDSGTVVQVGLTRLDSKAKKFVRTQVVSFGVLAGKREGRLIGKLIDDSSGMPVRGATLLVQNLSEAYRSDDTGGFAILFGAASDTLRLHVWHPDYDSIVVEFSKRYGYTDKYVTVHYEARRQRTELANTSAQALLILTKEFWGSDLWEPVEYPMDAYHYLVSDGSSFGLAAAWECNEKRAFRLVHLFPNNKAWVHFKDAFGLHERGGDGFSNFVVVGDSVVHLDSAMQDAAIWISLMLMPQSREER